MFTKLSIKHIFLYSLIIVTILSNISFANAPDTLWSKTFGGIYNDQGRNVQETSDGGYIFTGFMTTIDTYSEDACLVKTDSLGNILWSKTYGGSLSDRGHIVLPIIDSGYLIVGYTQSFGSGEYDIWLIRTNCYGDTIWTKTYGGSGNDYAFSAQQTLDEGYIIVGLTTSFDNNIDLWIIKIDSNGNIIWNKVMGGSENDQGRYVYQTIDEGYIISGYTESKIIGNRELWLIKTDSLGDTLWTKTYGGSYNESGLSVLQSSDAGYIVTGYTESFGEGGKDLWLVKTDENGDLLWSKTFGGCLDDYGHIINKTKNNGFIITGYTESYGPGDRDFWIIKTDSTGKELWTKIIGGINDDIGQYVIQCHDGGYIAIGITESFGQGSQDAWLIKLSADVIITADFIADTTFGVYPLTVTFKDLSSISDTSAINSWLWDFNNDGINDSEEQNPKWTYLKGGVYSVRLIVSNGILSDTLIKKNYIKVLSENPFISDIDDIPNDQGGWVKVKFIRSIYDTDTLIYPSSLYNTLSPEFYTIEIGDSLGWMAANTTIAYGIPEYSVIVHTTIDSSEKSDGLISFRVIAGMEEGNFVSDVVEGYSVDNIDPSVPTGLSASLIEGINIKLNWNKASDKDFNYFKIYRSTDYCFNTKDFFLYDKTNDTVYIDTQVEIGEIYSYYITTLDFAGNESDNSDIVYVSVTSIHSANDPIPYKFFINQNYPNPFNPSTTICYGIPLKSCVKITIFDILGNKIVDLVDGFKSPGRYEVIWNGYNNHGHQVSSGLYFFRITAGDFTMKRKMLLIR